MRPRTVGRAASQESPVCFKGMVIDMAGWRDIKRKARSTVHERFEVAAIYIPTPDLPSPPDPYPVTARLHTKFADISKVKGTSFDFAQVHDIVPKIILWKAEVATPKRNDIVSFAVGEAYRIDNVQPADDLTITVEIVPMKPADTVGLPVPEA
jgi:hypothetical protein